MHGPTASANSNRLPTEPTAAPIDPHVTYHATAMPNGIMRREGLEQGLDRVGDKILDADHGVKGSR